MILDGSKDSALCADLGSQLSIYHVFRVCAHAHTCAHVHLLEFVYSQDLRTGNHSGLTPIGLEKEECCWVPRPATFCHCTELPPF